LYVMYFSYSQRKRGMKRRGIVIRVYPVQYS